MEPKHSSITTLGRSAVTALLLISAIPACGQTRGYSKECTFWREIIVAPAHRAVQVGPAMLIEPTKGSPTESDFLGIASLSSEAKLSAINCLLQAEDDHRPALMSGSTTKRTSQIFAPAQANLAALYMISYVFTGRQDHALAVALRGPSASITLEGRYVTKSEAIGTAYKSYRKWFQMVRRIGICEAREKLQDPLKGSGLYWYGVPDPSRVASLRNAANVDACKPR